MSVVWTPILWGLACAIIGVVYATVLAGEDTPINEWFRMLDRARDRGGWRSWIASPLGGCSKCTSGQLALWSFSALLPWSWSVLSVGSHVLAGCSAVLFATVIEYGYRWLKNQI